MRRKIILDSNVWRYIVDAHGISELMRAARSSHHTIMLSPAVFREAARTKDAVVREKLLQAMMLPEWKRMMPEAFEEAEEIRLEVRRVRAEWLRQHSDDMLFKRARYDWIRAKGGEWDRVRSNPQVLVGYESDLTDEARQRAYELRAEAASWSPKWRDFPLTATTATLSGPLPGWDGTSVEAWRFSAQSAFEEGMASPEHPYFDWLGGEIDLRMMLLQKESLAKFWLHEVKLTSMRRQWTRWAFEFLQAQYRVTDGTPVDAQIGTYLVDADLMLSADKGLVRIAEKCREDAPFTVAQSQCVPAGDSCLDEVLRILSAA